MFLDEAGAKHIPKNNEEELTHTLREKFSILENG